MPKTIEWRTDTLFVTLFICEDQVVRLKEVIVAGAKQPSYQSQNRDVLLPLNEVRLAGEGNLHYKGPASLIDSAVSSRLKYKSHRQNRVNSLHKLEITSHDEKSQIQVTTIFSVFSGVPVLRSQATIENLGKQEVIVTQLSSFVMGGLSSTKEWWKDYTVSHATNTGLRESQWKEYDLPSVSVDEVGLSQFPECGNTTGASHSVSSRGTQSTGKYLPLGMLSRRSGDETWLWQIETNGSWKWEVGDLNYNIYLALSGPNRPDHDWTLHLAPKQSFTTVPVSMLHLLDGKDAAFAALTRHRRCIRRKHTDHDILPVIFNDYMNCLNGDPTEDRILTLLQPALDVGAEYFVIDAGWYADDNGWFDDVGLWKPSNVRFPSGFQKVSEKIKETGLVLGLWLEPEVIGARSAVAEQLPADAFFQDHGRRIIELGRYHLDFRHPAVLERMNEVVDRLVNDYGVGYFKLDYNIANCYGTDCNTSSPGAALLDHNRAFLAWLSDLNSRHPLLVLEACAGGGSRMDYASLSVQQLASTSDQQDPVLYAAIAASIPTALAPEQSGTWAYPQPQWSDDLNAFTMLNSMLGRLYLSGRIDQLNVAQLDLIRQGVNVYQGYIKPILSRSVPFWPLGHLPEWRDEWLALGLAPENINQDGLFVTLWRRPARSQHCEEAATAAKTDQNSSKTRFVRIANECHLELPMLHSFRSDNRSSEPVWKVDMLYPHGFEGTAVLNWQGATNGDQNRSVPFLKVSLPAKTCARLFWVHRL